MIGFITSWFKEAATDIRWWMLIWVLALAVVVWVLGAPAWVSVVFGVWLLYKENE